MKPVSKNQLVKDFAREMNLNEELVDTIITIYWKEVRLLMKDLKDNRIIIEKLGTLYIIRERLQKTIELTKAQLSSIPPTSFTNFTKCKWLENKVDKLEKIDNTLGNQKRRFDEIKRAKKEKRFLESKFPENNPGSIQLDIQEEEDRDNGT